jgi:hypothetical protein
MAPTTPITAPNIATGVVNGSVLAPTAYNIVAGDVTNGLSVPLSIFSGVNSGLNYGQAGFLLERVDFIFNTTTAGTAFSVVVKATQPQVDVANEAVPFPLANAGDLTININTIGTYYIGPLTSGRFTQPDGSILFNFTGTLGVTTLAILNSPYSAAGPRG